MTDSVIGIDEVGRGCLAGPLCIAAVFLLHDVPGLRDSKLLSAKKRQKLATLIKQSGYVGLGWVPAEEIDVHGMGASLRIAAQRAIAQLPDTVLRNHTIIIDGSIDLLPSYNASTLVKADTFIQSVMAASIVAKVARDAFMQQYDNIYPHYGFASNVGYGTARHMKAITEHGGSPLHRYSFEPLKSGKRHTWL